MGSIELFENSIALFPPRFSTLINRWTILAWNLAGFVPVVALYQRFCQAASLGKINLIAFAVVTSMADLMNRLGYALFVHEPIPHLLKELDLVHFVVGPAHVENVRLDLVVHEIPHQGRHTAMMIVPSTGEIIFVSIQHLNL